MRESSRKMFEGTIQENFNHCGWKNREPYDFQTEEWITKVPHPNLLRQIAFRFQKIGKVSHCMKLKERWAQKMGVVTWWIDSWTKFGNPSNCISLSASSKMIFPSYISIHRVVLLSDPWPILSFTFSHNRLLMDFRRQEKWILRDLLMMLSSTNIQFI